MISTYRRALAVPGALNFSLAALLARLPISMMGIGIVLLVTEQTGSYTLAGRLSAVVRGGQRCGALPVARLVDSLGQRTVLLPAGLVSATAMAAMVAAVTEGWSMALAYACAALAGLTLPNAGAAVRARWAHAVKDRPTLDTAFAWEAVADEIVFILGPTIVTFLAAWFDPVAALATAGTALVVGTVWLVSQRATEPPAPLPHDDAERPPPPPHALGPARHRGRGRPRRRSDVRRPPRWPRSPSPTSGTSRSWPGSCWRPGPSAAWSPVWRPAR